MSMARSLAVVGGGWAGLAAAVHGTRLGHAVTVFEMAPQFGGRARSTEGGTLDNGQHILIGAYRETLALMRAVGVDVDAVLLRHRLALRMADGRGMDLGPGPVGLSFGLAVLRARGWSWRDKLALLRACSRWALSGFACQPDRSVAELCADLPALVRQLLVDPLCVAALNTPAAEASAAIFLRVLKDGLFGGAGACDLLLPRRPLRELLPGPATAWLAAHGARLQLGQRVMSLHAHDGRWMLDDQAFDGVVVAASATENARLLRPLSADWAHCCDALRFEPIVTVYVHCPEVRLAPPMMALAEDAQSPAQFVFDHGALGGEAGRLAFVVSGAAPWVERGLDTIAQAVLAQAARELARHGWRPDRARVEHTVAERRATFRSTPGLQRPPQQVAPGLYAAGDHVAGPYPATLEGAVRSGLAAAQAFHDAK